MFGVSGSMGTTLEVKHFTVVEMDVVSLDEDVNYKKYGAGSLIELVQIALLKWRKICQ